MSLARQLLTPEEYLALERKAEHKSEFFQGCLYAMAGACARHNLIVGNVVRELGNQFKARPCLAFPSDMRVKVSATGLYTYPDASALCGDPAYEDEAQDTLLNPSLIIEVLSPSTGGYDRGLKFAHYRRVATVTDYVMIAQDEPRVEHYTRQPDGRWLLTEYREMQDVVELPSLGSRLPLAEIYDKVLT